MTNPVSKIPGVLACLTLPLQPPLERTLIVLPAPNRHRKITLADGRSFRIPDMHALAEQLNLQEPAVRIDWDHESEPEHPNYQHSTCARGWMSNWSVTPSGELMATARFIDGSEVRAHQFRYHSPSLRYDPTDDTILGISSIALTNRPALGECARIDGEQEPITSARAETESTESVDSAASHAPQPMQEMHLESTTRECDTLGCSDQEYHAQTRSTYATENEQTFRQAWLELAREHLDSAIASGKMGNGEKTTWLEAICSHRQGLAAGVALFRKSMKARPQLALAQRYSFSSPSDQHNQSSLSTPNLPPGYRLGPDRMNLHHRVTTLAARQKLPYEEALMHLMKE